MLDVLYEDNHLLAVNKPAGLITQGAAADEPSVIQAARAYLKHRYQKPGRVYVGVVSRLDAGTSGVVLLARTSKAASRVSAQLRDRQVAKTYWAWVEGEVASEHGVLEDFLWHDDAAARMRPVSPDTPGSQQAGLSYRVLTRRVGATLLEIQLETGRKHQIRVQWGSRGHAVLGDRKYGARSPFPQGLALHARSVRIEHPVRHEPLVIIAPPPESWRNYLPVAQAHPGA